MTAMPTPPSSRARARQLLARARALALVPALGCGAPHATSAEPVPEPHVAADPERAPEPAVAAEPEPEHFEILWRRSLRGVLAGAWEPETGTLVAVSPSGTLLVYRRADDSVRLVERIERAIDEARVFIAPAAALLVGRTTDGNDIAIRVDLRAFTTVPVDSWDSVTARAAPDGDLAVWRSALAALTLEHAGTRRTCELDAASVLAFGLTSDLGTGVAYVELRGAPPEAQLVDLRTCEIRFRDVVQSGTVLDLSDDGRTLVEATPSAVIAVDVATGARRTLADGGWDLAVGAGTVSFRASSEVTVHALSLDTGLPLPWTEERIAVELTGAASDERGAMLVPDGDRVLRLEGLAGGGAHSIHGAALHPRGRALTIHTRAGVVLVRASGIREVACLDERDAQYTPDGRTLVQAEDGVCDPETDEGTLATPAPDYDSGYSSGYSGGVGEPDEGGVEPADEEPPPWDEVCGPGGACVRIPLEPGAWTLVPAGGGRGRRLPGTADRTEVAWAPDGSFVAASSPAFGVRVFSIPLGREDRHRRTESGSVLEVLADGTLVIARTDGAELGLPDGRTLELGIVLRARDSIAEIQPGVLLVCARQGLRRVEIASGLSTSLGEAPCEGAAVLGDVLVTTSPGGGGERTVRRATDGSLVGTIPAHEFVGDASLEADVLGRCVAPAGADASAPRTDLEVIDVRTASTLRVVPDYCPRGWITAADGSMRLSASTNAVTLERSSDGASLALQLVWDGNPHGSLTPVVPHLVAVAPDGAFYVATEDELAFVQLVASSVAAPDARALRGTDEEARRRFYRPTLLADFLEGRPLPAASP